MSHARIARYKHSKNSCAESEWEDALKALLLPDQPIGNVTATARIADDEDKPTGDDSSYMFIDVRRGVSKDTVWYQSIFYSCYPLGPLKQSFFTTTSSRIRASRPTKACHPPELSFKLSFGTRLIHATYRNSLVR